MRILITGASGLLGSHLVKRCLECGHKVIANYRKITKRNYLFYENNNPNVSHEIFDLTDISSYPKLNNIDVVINSAAFASPFEKDHEKMISINVEAVKNLYNYSKDIGVLKFVQISSIASFGNENYGEYINESSVNFYRETAYGTSKRLADKWISEQIDLPVLTIHPCYMLGEWDGRPSSGAIFFMLKMKKLTYFINHIKNFVAASDVATGILDAIENSCTGNFILGGENHTIKNFFYTYSRITGDSVENIKELPDGFNNDENLLEKVDFDALKEFCFSFPVEMNKAINAFNYSPRKSLNEMISESVEYFSNMKMLRYIQVK